MIINRDDYLNKLIDKKDNGRIKIITGIRRCGKSFLLFTLFKNYLINNGVAEDQIIEIALDDIDNIKYRNPFELNDFIKRKMKDDKRYYIFIDEVQFSAEVTNPYVDGGDKITFVDVLLSLMKREFKFIRCLLRSFQLSTRILTRRGKIILCLEVCRI